MAADKKTVPTLRFANFAEEWEEKTCGNVLKESKDPGNNGDIARKMTVKLWGKGVVAKQEKGSAATKYFTRHAGQFIYSKLDFLNCAFGIVPEELDGYESTADLPAFDCVGVDPYFMLYRAIQPNFYLINGLIADGTRKAKRIHVDTFLNMPLILPNKAEQEKISKFLQTLDKLLKLYEKKLDQLKTQKQTFLQLLFPKPGERVPQIRFEGFSEPWEAKQLGEISTSYSGGTPTVGNKAYYNGTIPFIRSAEINSNATELFITETGLANSSAKMVAKGDILYALYGATSGNVGRARINGAINQAILAIKPIAGYDTEFLVQWLRSNKEAILNVYLQGGQGNLSAQIIKALIVNYPSQKEQAQIGAFFAALDNNIILHQEKLQQLKVLKQTLLKYIFV